MRRIIIGGLATGIAALAVISNPAMAANSTVVVGQSGDAGWTFNPDPANATPYAITTEEASIGNGSIHVAPIVNAGTGQQKFIGALDTPAVPVSDFGGFSFDFMIEGDASDAEHFYANVYVNSPTGTGFGQCRYDFAASTGSTSSFSTLSFNGATTPDEVVDRAPLDGFTCTPTLAGLAPGSTINIIAINVGDTSMSDEGVGGFLDNAQLTVGSDTTTYNFDVDANDDGISDTVGPTNKDQCKKGGYASFNNPSFRNQGECVSYVNHNS
jgi:hypothetical protein